MQPYYTQLFAMNKNLFTPGAPVVIASATLVQDSQNGQLYSQLVLENINPVPIVSIKLEVTGLDPADRPLTQPMEHYLMDVNAPRGTQFGSATLFPMPHPAVRSFSFRILEIILADKTIWTGEDCVWTALPASRTLEDTLGDAELAKQYRLEYGQNAWFAPVMLEELYLCSCGAPNRHQYACARCGASPTALSDTLIDSLREKADDRLAQEAQQAEQARQLAAEQQRLYEEEQARKAVERQLKKEAQAAKWKGTGKKILRAAIWTVVSLVAVFALLVATHLWILPEINYRLALSSINKGDYENAYRLFNLLEDYRDSEEYLARFAVKETCREVTWDYSRCDSDTDSYGSRAEYKYDSHGYVTWRSITDLILDDRRFVPDPEEEASISESSAKRTYNNAGNLLEVLYEDNSRTVYTYNSAGKMIKSQEADSENQLTEETLYTYDSNNNLTKKQFFEDGELTEETLYTYDSQGNMTKYVSKDISSNTTSTGTYEYDGDKVTKYVYEHVDHNDPDNNSKSTTVYSYNIAGDIKKQERKTDGGLVQTITYKYNAFGELTEYEETRKNEDYRESTIYRISYNILGHMTAVEGTHRYKAGDTSYTRKVSAEITCYLDGTMKEVDCTYKYTGQSILTDYEEHIEYAETGLVTERKTTQESGLVYTEKTDYTYFYYPEGTLKPSEY